jgi:hypothetical protein
MYKFIYNKSTWRNKCYQFHFDVNSEAESTLIVKGWFVNKSTDNYHIRVVDQNGNIIDAIEHSKKRPKLTQLFPDIENVIRSGFEVDTKTFFPNQSYFIAIFKDEDELLKVVTFVNKEPLLYVHIAKTAGSTVNKVLTEYFGKQKSLLHAESIKNWTELVKQQKVNFLSGHIPYKLFIKVSELQCYKKAITFREPFSHVVSHLSWIRALALTENINRYNEHPEYIQKLCDKLESYDLACPEEITDVINSFDHLEHRLLDNTQTRYIRTELAKEAVDAADLADAIENLRHFDFVGTDNDISGFLSDIAIDYGFVYKVEDHRENVLNNKFGLDINNPAIKAALFPLVKYDLELYNTVQLDEINFTYRDS